MNGRKVSKKLLFFFFASTKLINESNEVYGVARRRWALTDVFCLYLFIWIILTEIYLKCVEGFLLSSLGGSFEICDLPGN